MGSRNVLTQQPQVISPKGASNVNQYSSINDAQDMQIPESISANALATSNVPTLKKTDIKTAKVNILSSQPSENEINYDHTMNK